MKKTFTSSSKSLFLGWRLGLKASDHLYFQLDEFKHASVFWADLLWA